MVKVLDREITVTKFKLNLHYYTHFRANALGKGMNLLIFPAISYIVPLLFFYKDGFGIK